MPLAQDSPQRVILLKNFLVAHIHHGYTPKEIADYLQIHYFTVSKVIATVAPNET
jgi:hypothetical protein